MVLDFGVFALAYRGNQSAPYRQAFSGSPEGMTSLLIFALFGLPLILVCGAFGLMKTNEYAIRTREAQQKVEDLDATSVTRETSPQEWAKFQLALASENSHESVDVDIAKALILQGKVLSELGNYGEARRVLDQALSLLVRIREINIARTTMETP